MYRKRNNKAHRRDQPLGETKISLTKFDGNAPTLPFFTPIHHPSSICCVDRMKERRSTARKYVREHFKDTSSSSACSRNQSV